jgi:hypothetical protein
LNVNGFVNHSNRRTSIKCLYTECPRRKVNNVGHFIGHSKQKVYMYICPVPNGFRNRAISLYTSKIFHKKETLRTVYNTGVY